MNEIEKSRTSEIKDLHVKFVESLKKTLDCGIRIGELLKQQKDDSKHGEFGKWIEENLPFSIRTAQNYMKLHREQDRLKSATVSHLTEGYRLLLEPKKEETIFDMPLDWIQDFIEVVNADINDKRFEIQNNVGWLFSKFPDDGSMTANEKARFELIMNVCMHFCFHRHYIWHKGTESLPGTLVDYITEISSSDINTKPKPACGKDKCPQEWENSEKQMELNFSKD